MDLYCLLDTWGIYVLSLSILTHCFLVFFLNELCLHKESCLHWAVRCETHTHLHKVVNLPPCLHILTHTTQHLEIDKYADVDSIRDNKRPPILYWEWSKNFPTNNTSSALDCAHWGERCARVVKLASIALYTHGHIRVSKFRRNASFLVCRAMAIHAIHAASGNRRRLAACTGISRGRSLSI